MAPRRAGLELCAGSGGSSSLCPEPGREDPEAEPEVGLGEDDACCWRVVLEPRLLPAPATASVELWPPVGRLVCRLLLLLAEPDLEASALPDGDGVRPDLEPV